MTDPTAQEPRPLRSGAASKALARFCDELSVHDSDGDDHWSDSAVLLLGQLAADLDADDLQALGTSWPTHPHVWQRHCAEVLGMARPPESIAALLGMAERGSHEVALAALESLGDVEPVLFSVDQRKSALKLVEAMLDRALSPSRRLLLGELHGRLRARITGAS